MSYAINASWTNADTPVYTVAQYSEFVLDGVRFTLNTDTSGQPHHATVQITDASGLIPFFLMDANTAVDGGYYVYSFMRGATMTHCTLESGDFVESPLPTTVLSANTQILIYSLGTNGNEIAGDTFDSVVLYGEQVQLTDPNAPDQPLQSITLLPSAVV